MEPLTIGLFVGLQRGKRTWASSRFLCSSLAILAWLTDVDEAEVEEVEVEAE